MIRMLFLLFSFFLVACDQMYDEEFEEFEARRNQTVSGSSYSAELQTTDDSVPGIEGDVSISVRNNDVSLDLNVSGIPQNLTQIHYGFINNGCLGIEREFSADLTSTKNFNISENTSLDAIRDDLAGVGADDNLDGKSFVVKAFPQMTVPDAQGVTPVTIACGVLQLDEGTLSNDDIFGPGSEAPADPGDDSGTEFPDEDTSPFPPEAGSVGPGRVPGF